MYNFTYEFLLIDFQNHFFNISNLKNLANIIYQDFFFIFILLSIVLLIALLGAIVLTSRRTLFLKEQSIFKQNQRFILYEDLV
jgi:multisubunit Na+/H+ antiporter MnhB subunit